MGGNRSCYLHRTLHSTTTPAPAAVEVPRIFQAGPIRGNTATSNKMFRSVVTKSQYVDQAMADDFIAHVHTRPPDMAQVLGSTLIEFYESPE